MLLGLGQRPGARILLPSKHSVVGVVVAVKTATLRLVVVVRVVAIQKLQ
jgi:hypothetical protein